MNPQEATQKLRTMGWTDRQMAAAAKSSQSVINRARLGYRQPSYNVGVALVEMAKRGRKPPKRKSS